MNRRLIVLLAGATMLVACGSDNNSNPTPASVCSKVSTVWPTVATKLTACPTIAALLTAFTVPTGDACTQKIAACSSDDIPKLNTFLDCIGALPTCQAGGDASWYGSLTTCYTPLTVGNTAVTQACMASLGLVPAA